MKKILILVSVIILIYFSFKIFKSNNFNSEHNVGDKLDSLNGVYVYFNGGVSNVEERNLSEDGYNIGLKYQCVEFIKRYYYEFLNHKMPDTYGNAKDFFDHDIKDGEINPKRDLIQFTNPSISKPEINDIIVFDGNLLNIYGHVAIISDVGPDYIEIIQQNPGPYSDSREKFKLNRIEDKWEIEKKSILGYLRKVVE